MIEDTKPLPSQTPPPRLSVLLVDDNDAYRLVLSRWLDKKGGYRVVEAGDGEEALRWIQSEPFDLVILDILMPRMSGLDVLQELRKSFSSEALPIVMATARDDSDDIVKAFELGANDYITKPIDYPVALARIQAQLRSKQPAECPVPEPLPEITAPQEVRPGMVLEGKYRLDEIVGAGSNGAVFRATHLSLGRQVAIKVLHTGLREARDEVLKPFRQEGVSACRVNHPNAVAVLDFTVSRNGIVFLVMELLRGHSVQEEIRRAGRLSAERCAEIVLPVCDVLTEAHSLGILHRDIKPQNTFLHQSRRGEVVKVLDFGLAKLLEKTKEIDPTLDVLAGTLAYIAPERVAGESYDGRVDVYSLGVTMYEMLTGVLPFHTPGNNPVQMMMMHVTESPPPLSARVPGLDPAVEEIVFAALEKKPRNRPTAFEIKEMLTRTVGAAPATS